MSRNLSTAALAATGDESVLEAIAVELDFSSGPVRVNTSDNSIWIDGNEYLGLGDLGQISSIEESAEIKLASVTLSLGGIPRDSVAIALNEHYQGRRATIWLVPLDKVTYQPVADPVIIMRGKIDQMLVAYGETCSVQVTVTNGLAIWDQALNRRYTHEEQQRRHPGDRFFAYVNATAEKNIVWPAAGFQQGGQAAAQGGISQYASTQG